MIMSGVNSLGEESLVGKNVSTPNVSKKPLSCICGSTSFFTVITHQTFSESNDTWNLHSPP